MKTIALRFSDHFAPSDGTIAEHRKLIDETGFVWYGKLGSKVSLSVAKDLLLNQEPRILLIHSGKAHRYWAYVQSIMFETPPLTEIPVYYRSNAEKFGTWFKISKIQDAPKDVLVHCRVLSSKRLLSEVSKSSMSPYFIIEVEEDNGTTE